MFNDTIEGPRPKTSPNTSHGQSRAYRLVVSRSVGPTASVSTDFVEDVFRSVKVSYIPFLKIRSPSSSKRDSCVDLELWHIFLKIQHMPSTIPLTSARAAL